MFDAALIAKYDKPGPRYTSYPTALLFRDGFPLEQAADLLAEQGSPGEAVSLYVHVPFCHQLCWYCGCSMLVARNRSGFSRHVDLLLREMSLVAQAAAGQRQANQVHFGGGTPTYLEPEQLEQLVQGLRRFARFTRDVEMSIEIDPRQLSDAHIETLARCQFNRASLGVQDFDPQVQEAVHRIQPFELVAERLAALRQAAPFGINFDLIYGLPRQTMERFRLTLQRVMELQPDRISLFNYAHIPWKKPHMKLIRSEDLPSAAEKLGLLCSAIEFFTEHGYVYVGMDHFARPEDPLVRAMAAGTLQRNFQGYSTHGGQTMFGFGMSSIAMFESAYLQNTPDLTLYEKWVSEGRLPIAKGLILTEDDRVRRQIIHDLMVRFILSPSAIEQRMGAPFDQVFPTVRSQLEEMAQDGLLEREGQDYKVSFLGRLLIRNVAMLFDRYVDPALLGRYSRTV